MARKKHYGLWWEYLKRSDDYRIFCKVIKKEKRHKEARKISCTAEAAIFVVNNKGDNLNEEFKKSSTSRLFVNFLELYGFFGNVHADSFEKWWSTAKKQIENMENIPALVDYTSFMKIDLLFCAETLKNVDGKVPTIERLINYFPIFLKKRYLGGAFLLVNVARKSKKELNSQFEKFIVHRKEEPATRKLEQDSKRNYKPFASAIKKEISVKVNELERYLEVYDLWKKHKIMSYIIEKQGKDSKNPDHRSMVHGDLKRAKKIIKNVEQGEFPGNYQPKN